MKNIFFILSFFICLNSFSQYWTNDSASWIYSYSNYDLSEVGYVELKKLETDTIIESKTCSVIEKSRFSYYYPTASYSEGVYGREFIYFENNKVFHFRNDHFYTLYDFSASIGEFWEIEGPNSCSNDTIIVDNVEIINYNGVDLKTLTVHSKNNNYYLGTTIIERLGSTYFLFPNIWFNCEMDNGEAGDLRCYSDIDSWFYKNDNYDDCRFITNVGLEEKIKSKFVLYPNPSNDLFVLEMKENNSDILNLEITNQLGEIVKIIHSPQKVKENSFEINCSELNTGIYFVYVYENDKKYTFKLIKN